MIYVAITSKENFNICLNNNLFADRKDSKLKKLEREDILIFYIKGKQGKGCFNAIAKVKDKVIYKPIPIKEFSDHFPYIVNLDFLYILKEEENWIKLKDIADKLEAVRDKQAPPGKFFQSCLRSLQENDYNLIEQLIKEKIQLETKLSIKN